MSNLPMDTDVVQVAEASTAQVKDLHLVGCILLAPFSMLQSAKGGMDPSFQLPGAKKPCTVLGGGETVPPGLVSSNKPPSEVASAEPTSSADTLTSKDYYFDSYSHFGGL